MKKVVAVYKDPLTNELSEKIFFADKASEISKTEGVLAIVSVSRVKHPSPVLLGKTVDTYIISGEPIVSLAQFYAYCEMAASELKDEADAAKTN